MWHLDSPGRHSRKERGQVAVGKEFGKADGNFVQRHAERNARSEVKGIRDRNVD